MDAPNARADGYAWELCLDNTPRTRVLSELALRSQGSVGPPVQIGKSAVAGATHWMHLVQRHCGRRQIGAAGLPSTCASSLNCLSVKRMKRHGHRT
jgi:hypothetical protein